MSVLDALNDFQLELLPSDWIDIVYAGDFSYEKEIPDEYALQVNDKDYAECMLQLIDALKNWTSDGRESVSSAGSETLRPESFKKSWQVLGNCKVDPKPLLCFISMFIRNDIKEFKDKEMVYLAFVASRLYINLLAVPGAIPFNVFNSFFFDQALGILKLGNFLGNKVSNTSGSKLSPKKKGKHTSKTKKKSSNDAEVNDEDDETADSEHDSLAVNFDDIVDKKVLLDQILLLLNDLQVCLMELHLKEDLTSLDNLAQLLVSLTRLETETNVFEKNPPPNTVGQIALKSYYILEQLLEPQHGEIKRTVLAILSIILPTILYNEQNIMMLGRRKSSEKDHTFSFIQKIILEIGEPVHDGVKAFIQQMCVRMPDKADLRSKAALDIVKLMQLFPSHLFQDIVLWVISFSHEELVKYRSCATEVISKLLNVADKMSEHEPESAHLNAESNENINANWTSEKGLLQKLLVSAILSRSVDVSPIIRAKCLGIFSSFLTTNQAKIKKLMDEMFINPTETNLIPLFNFEKFFAEEDSKITLPQNPLPSGRTMMRIMERLVFDKKVHPRKNALSVIGDVCLNYSGWITSHRIAMMVNGCRDYSVMPRKLMSKCLTDLLLKNPTRTELVNAWVQGVLPLVADNEVKCQEKIIEFAQYVILDNIVDHNKSSTPLGRIPWLIIAEIACKEKRSLFKFVCRSWSLQKTVTTKKFQMLKTHIGTENNIAAWYLIVCLSEFHDVPFAGVIYEYYLNEIYGAKSVLEQLSQLVIEALYLNWKGLDNSDQNELYSKLRTSLLNFSIPVPLISRSLDICHQINKSKTVDLCEKLIDLCEDFIRNRIAPDSTMEIKDEEMARHFHTLGDAAHFHPGVSTDIINYLANYIAPEYIYDEGIPRWKGPTTERTKAIGIATLGKICLQDDFLAITYAPVLASLLTNGNASVGVKINTMVALTDMCVRFTSVVENHLGEMCITLKDNSDFVRRNTIQLLTQLIQEDYLKVRIPMFFYLLTSLNDKSDDIKELAGSLIANRIIKRNGNAMCQFFVQSIFFYNNHKGLGEISTQNNSCPESSFFSLEGKINEPLRWNIYKFILRFLMDDHRFKISNRLILDIFDEACEGGSLVYDDAGIAVLTDAMFALSCEEMRFEQLRKDIDDKDMESESDKGRQNVVLGIARKAVLSAVLKRNYIDTVIPILLKFKQKLEKENTELCSSLLICIKEIMKDYKEEINELFSNDPDLAAQLSLKYGDKNETVEENAIEKEDLEYLLEGTVDLEYVRYELKLISENIIDNAAKNSQVAPNDVTGNSQVAPNDITGNSQSAEKDVIEVTINGTTQNSLANVTDVTENSQDSGSEKIKSRLVDESKGHDTDSEERSTTPLPNPSNKRTSRSTSSTPEKPPTKKNKPPRRKDSSPGDNLDREDSDNLPQPCVTTSKKRQSHQSSSQESERSPNRKRGKKKKSKSN